MKRRNLLAGLAATMAAGCSKVAETEPMASLLHRAEDWHRKAHRALASNKALAPEFSPQDISANFRGNGTLNPATPAYEAAAESNFADWRLEVRGLVGNPLSLSMSDIRALPQRTQITRHDCVEGWSAIGKWTGPQLGTLLDQAKLSEDARYIIFRCADKLGGSNYYESVDLVDAYHPQTIIAHMLNDAPLPIANGAPLRMRIERQLGYKHAKYLTAIEAVADLSTIGEGKGGYWEDRADYAWYAGI